MPYGTPAPQPMAYAPQPQQAPQTPTIDRAVAEITGDDETSIFKAGPVADIEAFRQRLEFLSISAVNASGRVITAKPAK